MTDQQKRGIWIYDGQLPAIPRQYQITLGEGSTPLEKKEGIFFKLEYENPTGSVKDRACAYQISTLVSRGIKKAVISSSGNAAISASEYCSLAGIELTVFVNPHIHPQKLDSLKRKNVFIIQSKRPKSDSIKYAKEHSLYNLRHSTDEGAKAGFMTLGFELAGETIDAVFIPVSSGTTLVGMYEGLMRNGKNPAIHIVQTTGIHPIASKYDHDFPLTRESLADAIVARSTPRQHEIEGIIRKSNGWGWVMEDDQIRCAHAWLQKNNLMSSYEGAAALSAYWKAEEKGYSYQNPLIVLTGKLYE